MEQQGEIILYQPDESVRMEVRIEDETVWLTQAQIVELFQSSKANISEHLKNIYKSEELIQSSTVRNFRTVQWQLFPKLQKLLFQYLHYIMNAFISKRKISLFHG